MLDEREINKSGKVHAMFPICELKGKPWEKGTKEKIHENLKI